MSYLTKTYKRNEEKKDGFCQRITGTDAISHKYYSCKAGRRIQFNSLIWNNSVKISGAEAEEAEAVEAD